MSNTESIIEQSLHDQQNCCLPWDKIMNYAQIEPGEVCVDLGSKQGANTLMMAKETGSNGFVYGIYTSDEMIKQSFKSAEMQGITNVDFIHSKLEKIKLGNELADLITSNCPINQANNRQAVWNEIYRVLKKGGRFAVSDTYTVPRDDYFTNSESTLPNVTTAPTRREYLEILYNTGFVAIRMVEESAPYENNNQHVVNFIVTGEKPGEKKSCRCWV